MIFRVIEYVIQIYKAQIRAWLKDHPTLASDKSSDAKTGSSAKDSTADPYSAALDSLTSTSTSKKSPAKK